MKFSEIHRAIANAADILIVSHLRPDGDALGSCLAMASYIESFSKKATIWNTHGCPEKYSYLPHYEKIKTPPEQPQAFDLVIALDTSTKERLGNSIELVAGNPPILNIDHHATNENFGVFNYVDETCPATGQIIFEFLSDAKFALDVPTAECLYVAISTDTGSFQYRGCDERTFRAATDLVQAGVDVARLSLDMYASHPMRRFRLLRHALGKAEFFCDGKIAVIKLTRAEVTEIGSLPEDNEGIIEHIHSIEGVVCSCFFEECLHGLVRISARSKDQNIVNVSEICSQFGGGGHALAAGARLPGTLDEISTKFIETLCHALRTTCP